MGHQFGHKGYAIIPTMQIEKETKIKECCDMLKRMAESEDIEIYFENVDMDFKDGRLAIIGK